MEFQYDIVVVGAGHAGCEAAMAAGNMGSKVLLITMDMNKIAQMSCHPASRHGFDALAGNDEHLSVGWIRVRGEPDDRVCDIG